MDNTKNSISGGTKLFRVPFAPRVAIAFAAVALTTVCAALVVLTILAVLGLDGFLTVPSGYRLGVLALLLIAAVTTGLLAVLLDLLCWVTLRYLIEVGPQGVRYRLPSRRTLPFLPLHSGDLAYGEIKAIETRREIATGFLRSSTLTVYSLLLADGRRLVLGGEIPWMLPRRQNWMPAGTAAREIAARARLSLVDRGAVHWSGAAVALASPPVWDVPSLSAAEEARLTATSAKGQMRVYLSSSLLMMASAIVLILAATYSWRAAMGQLEKIQKTRTEIQTLLQNTDTLIAKGADAQQTQVLTARKETLSSLLRNVDELTATVRERRYLSFGQYISALFLIIGSYVMAWRGYKARPKTSR
jgi:hypothetical protein